MQVLKLSEFFISNFRTQCQEVFPLDSYLPLLRLESEARVSNFQIFFKINPLNHEQWNLSEKKMDRHINVLKEKRRSSGLLMIMMVRLHNYFDSLTRNSPYKRRINYNSIYFRTPKKISILKLADLPDIEKLF